MMRATLSTQLKSARVSSPSARLSACVLRSAGSVLVGAAALCAAACDGGLPAIDASAAPSARASAVSLRIDVPAERPATLTVLAFRAALLGVSPSDVLGIVDPRAAAAPAQDCQIRDVDRTVAALVAQGQAVELEELAGIGVSFGDAASDVRPTPRLYPDVAATVGGVVAAAGPVVLGSVPQQVRVSSTPPGTLPNAPLDTAAAAVPAAAWLRSLNGAVPHDGNRIDATRDVTLILTAGDAATTVVELRPLGATVALSCAVPASKLFAGGGEIGLTVSRQALGTLLATLGSAPGAPVATSLDLVRRTSETLPVSHAEVAVEVRTSTLVELRP